MFELFNDIYFVVYKLYYVSQNDNLGIRVSLKNWNRGSSAIYLHMAQRKRMGYSNQHYSSLTHSLL
jgi:hypothetical protein